MILTGKEIIKKHDKGDIFISNFNKDKVNPNSYNLKLHNKLLVYKGIVLNCKKHNNVEEITIPEKGFVLEPGKLYLGKTAEYTETWKLVPMVEGRSSLGRLGLFVHVTAGFGDVGFCGNWTLELAVVQPVMIYPWIECCQIYYNTVKGKITNYQGKYQHSHNIESSKMHLDHIKQGERNK
jgi:dCTP deaminase